MFERFTDRARRVVVLAQEEARLLNHNYIGTEHVLLGLIHEGEGLAAKCMELLGVSLDGARKELERKIGLGTATPQGHIPFTPRAKKIMELALREALQLGHNYIGTEHLLLGLLREGEGVGAEILIKLGLDLAKARQAVLQLMHGYLQPSVSRTRTDPPGLFEGPQLTDRETDVVDHIAKGESNAEIAASLSISEATVTNHVRNILMKLHLHSRMQAVIVEAGGQRQTPDVVQGMEMIVLRLDAIEQRLAAIEEGLTPPA